MREEANRYWPFVVPPPEERSVSDQEKIGIFETAYAEGFRPYMFGINFGAGDPAGRVAKVIYRGGHSIGGRWEPWFKDVDDEGVGQVCPRFIEVPPHTCICFRGFGSAADAMLRWVRGESGRGIFGRYELDTSTWPNMLIERARS